MYDINKDCYTNYRVENGTLPCNLIVCSYKDSKGRIWWGSFGAGALYFENNSFHTLKSNNNEEYPLYIRRITEDNIGNLWFATFTQGIFCLDKDGKFTNYNNTNCIISTNYIADFAYSEGKILYIATSSGLFSMDIYSKEMKWLETTDNGDYFTNDNFANCIFIDSRGLLWIGGRKGLNVYNKKDDSIYSITTDDGLSNNNIKAIQEDNNKNIWITTDHGITHININKDHSYNKYKFLCYPYFEKDGIGNFTFNNFAIFRCRNNDILIGGSGGYLRINISQPDFYSDDHKIIFTGLYIANQRIDVDYMNPEGRIILRKNIQLSEEINLNYSDNNFAIEVSAMDYSNLHKLQYVYRFGNDEDWLNLEGNRIYFNKLSPGKYKLQVKVNEIHNFKNNKPSYLTIVVNPPLWSSIPAMITYVLIVILFIVCVILRMRMKHKRVLSQQKKEMEIAKIHEMDEAKIKFFTNVSHDIRTPLSLIITPIEKLISSNKNQHISKELDLIRRNASFLMDEVNQLLDFRKLDQKKMSYNPSFDNISEYIETICESFEGLSIKNGIKFIIDIKEKNIETNFDKTKFRRIILNLLSNAVKYNNENGEVKISVEKTILRNEDMVKISVADTGFVFLCGFFFL